MSTQPKFTPADWPEWAQPMALIQAIFAKMSVRYGSMWSGRHDGTESMLLLRDWGIGLAGFRKEAIIFALDNLPEDSPPLLGQFKTLCIRAPEPPRPVLEAPRPDPRHVAGEIGRMREAQVKRDRLQWALDLQERHERGESLTEAQRNAYRDALAHTDPAHGMSFALVPEDALPPAMRREEHRA